MINIKPVIYKELQKVADNVTDTYPSDWETFPVVIFLEEQNKPGDWFDDQEQKSSIRYKVDIFDDTSTSELAVKINQIFESLGLRRTDCQDVTQSLFFNLEWRIKHVSKWNYAILWRS
ncbi:conserved structural protein, putative [Streptococcus pneumoniae]|nr:conserved structural protein, putative [Streptococcus pneumoniae]